MPLNNPVTRRNFIRNSALASIAILPARVAIGKNNGEKVTSPNELIRLAVIGIGNQGNRDRQRLIRSGLCEVVALCDIDMEGEHTQEARYQHRLTTKPPVKEDPSEPNPEVFNKARGYKDFRKMFDEMADQIDAVLVATPDHSHFSATMLAMSLGKHVFVEKPLAHTFEQCELMMNLAKRSGVVTQMGNQGHSGGNYFQFKAWSEAGLISGVERITAFMNNPRRWHGWGTSVKEYPDQTLPDHIAWDVWADCAKVHPFSDKLHPQEWRSWFDYGSGAFGDWGPHILDTAHRFLNLGLPEQVRPVNLDGRNDLVYPQSSTIEFKFPARGSEPPCTVTWYDGVDNKPTVEEELGELNDDGKTRKPVTIDEPGKIIYAKDLVFMGRSHGSVLTVLPKEKFLDIRRSLPRFPQRNSDHYANFLLACKGEETARSPFVISAPLTQLFSLGIIAQRLGVTLKFDRESKQFVDNKLAQSLLGYPPRRGWEEFYRM